MPDLTDESTHDTIYPGWTTSTTRPVLLCPESAQLVFGSTEQPWPESLSSPDPSGLYILYL